MTVIVVAFTFSFVSLTKAHGKNQLIYSATQFKWKGSSYFIHFSISYQIVDFQDNAVNDVCPWTLDDGFAPSEDKGVVCSKISVT